MVVRTAGTCRVPQVRVGLEEGPSVVSSPEPICHGKGHQTD